MSGGNSSKNKSRSKRQEGWEEAGGEFYQELYPGGEADVFEHLQRADAAKLATLLPSKQARNTTTVKRVRSQNERRQATYARTTHSRDNQLSMLPDLSENLSNEERTWEEIMQIKAMPVPMHQKRDLKARLQNATKLRLQGLEQLHWRQRKVCYSFTIRFKEILAKLELWHSPMREIEGKFGTGVVSYFIFLRWLLFLNIVISLIVIAFLIVPMRELVEENLNCTVYDTNSTICCSEAYLERNVTYSNVFLDVIQGTGVMEHTILFYGVYSNQIIRYFVNLWDGEMYYNMPLAYLLVPVSWVLISLVAIVTAGAKGFKERLVESEGQFYKYCNIVFGGWDFCIHNEKSAKIKHKGILNEVKAFLEEEKIKEERQSRTRESQIILFIKRVFAYILVLLILLASGVIIYVVFNHSMQQLEKTQNRNFNATQTQLSTIDIYLTQLKTTLLEFQPFLCIVGLNLIVPVVFNYIIRFENYTPANQIIVTLLRTVLLRLSSLAVLISQIYSQIQNSNLVCALNNNDAQRLECWETYVGQQLYKLILTDFAVQFIMTFFVNLPRSFIARHTSSRFLKIIGEQEFFLPKHVLDIVYVQSIIWMGTFFCPFLPIFGTIFYFLIFYIKRFACLVNCTPSPFVYKTSKSKSLFMSVLLLGFVISIGPVAYSIAEISPSLNCGPFRGLPTVWELAIQTFDEFPDVIRNFIFWISTSTFAVPAFAFLLFFLYYFWTIANANRHMVSVLKNQLVLEGHDKQFLLNRLSAFIRQHQSKCEKRTNASYADDDSSIIQDSR